MDDCRLVERGGKRKLGTLRVLTEILCKTISDVGQSQDPKCEILESFTLSSLTESNGNFDIFDYVLTSRSNIKCI